MDKGWSFIIQFVLSHPEEVVVIITGLVSAAFGKTTWRSFILRVIYIVEDISLQEMKEGNNLSGGDKKQIAERIISRKLPKPMVPVAMRSVEAEVKEKRIERVKIHDAEKNGGGKKV